MTVLALTRLVLVAAFMTRLGRVWMNTKLSREQPAAFAATLTGEPDAYGALLVLVSAALLSDRRGPVRRRLFGPRRSAARRLWGCCGTCCGRDPTCVKLAQAREVGHRAGGDAEGDRLT